MTGKKKSSIHAHQQLHSHMNIYKLSFSQSASQGCGTWQTLHTFILSRLLIMGERHTSCDWILSLTQGCTDLPASPSSITQNKWRSISRQMNKEKKEREREREGLGEKKQNQEHSVRWTNDIIMGNTFLPALGLGGSVFHCVMIAGADRADLLWNICSSVRVLARVDHRGFHQK